MSPEEKIEKKIQKMSFKAGEDMQKKILEDTLKAQLKTKQTDSAATRPNIRRIIMKSPITKLAAAAVMVISVFLVIHYSGGSVTSVTWAEVAGNVERIDTFRFSMEIIVQNNEADTLAKDEQVQWNIYLSSKYGFRMEISSRDNLVSWYVPVEKDKIIIVIPREKKWIQMPFSQDYAQQCEQKDPRDYIKRFMSCEYTELGQQTIDGIEVEGIEVINPPTDIEHLENAVGRLWVDVETQLPIWIEIEGNVDSNTVQCNMDFRWNEEFDASVFQIPSDYTQISQ